MVPFGANLPSYYGVYFVRGEAPCLFDLSFVARLGIGKHVNNLALGIVITENM